MPEKSGDERLRDEFNRWADEGRGEEMEKHHISIAEQTIRLMELRPGDRVLDLGCGAGWATRILAHAVEGGEQGSGQVVGLDVSDEMIRRARATSRDIENILYVWGSATEIPWEEDYFEKVLSIESFYYYPDQDAALDELFRVMAPGGSLCIDQPLQRQSVFAALGGRVECACPRALGAGICGIAAQAWLQ
jgi:arsenite methyltransferase